MQFSTDAKWNPISTFGIISFFVGFIPLFFLEKTKNHEESQNNFMIKRSNDIWILNYLPKTSKTWKYINIIQVSLKEPYLKFGILNDNYLASLNIIDYNSLCLCTLIFDSNFWLIKFPYLADTVNFLIFILLFFHKSFSCLLSNFGKLFSSIY